MPLGQTKPLSVHKFRRVARLKERKYQKVLDKGMWKPDELPGWARGVRVRKVGSFQYIVEATSWEGH
jgi:hypothetical protein